MYAPCQRNIQRYPTREIGTFVISYRATTYGADERWAGKILENVEKMRDDGGAAETAEAVTRERKERKRGRRREERRETERSRGITRSEETGNGDERVE